MRTIDELLYIVKKEFIYDNYSGLCDVINNLRYKHIISDDEHNYVYNYIRNNKPRNVSTDSLFWYKPHLKPPRIKWLNKHIQKHSVPLYLLLSLVLFELIKEDKGKYKYESMCPIITDLHKANAITFIEYDIIFSFLKSKGISPLYYRWRPYKHRLRIVFLVKYIVYEYIKYIYETIKNKYSKWF